MKQHFKIINVMMMLLFVVSSFNICHAAPKERPIGEKVAMVTDSDWISNEEIIYAKHIRYVKFDYSWLASMSKGFETVYKTENYLIKRNIYTGEEEVLLEGPHMGALSFSPMQNMCAVVVYEERSPGDSSGPRSVHLFDMVTRELRMIVEGAERPLFSPNGEIIYCEIQSKPVLYWMDTGKIENIYEQGFVPFGQWDRKTNELICKAQKEENRVRYDPYTRKTSVLDLQNVSIFNWDKDGKYYFRNSLLIKDKDWGPDVPDCFKKKEYRGKLSPDATMVLAGLHAYNHQDSRYVLDVKGYERTSIHGRQLP